MFTRTRIVSIVVVSLVSLVVAIPVLSAIFAEGGPYDGLNRTISGYCRYTQGTGATAFNATVTDALSGAPFWQALPAGGIDVTDGTVNRAGEIGGTGFETSDFTTSPTFTGWIGYIAVGDNRYIISAAASEAAVQALATNSCNSSTATVASVADAAAAGNARVNGVVTALETNNYTGILVAVIALIPLSLIGAAAYSFWQWRSSRTRGGRSRRGRRR